ncbi:hypothetical protein [Pseudomonas fluorescens]
MVGDDDDIETIYSVSAEEIVEGIKHGMRKAYIDSIKPCSFNLM